MTAQTYWSMDRKSEAIDSKQALKAKRFVLELVANGVDLKNININDFSSSYPYKVYVGYFHVKNGLRIYKRFSQRDIDSCLRWYNIDFIHDFA